MTLRGRNIRERMTVRGCGPGTRAWSGPGGGGWGRVYAVHRIAAADVIRRTVKNVNRSFTIHDSEELQTYQRRGGDPTQIIDVCYHNYTTKF